MQKCGRQKVLIKFFLCSKTQIDGKLRSPIFLLGIRTKRCVWGRNSNFPLMNNIKYKHADYLYTYHWKIMSNKSNAGHVHSFMRLPKVSRQLYTFSCAQLKNCHFVLCYMLKMIFPSAIHMFWETAEETWWWSFTLIVAVKRCGRL